MFEQFVTPINYPALIKMQSMANVTRISPESIKGLKANEKAMNYHIKILESMLYKNSNSSDSTNNGLTPEFKKAVKDGKLATVKMQVHTFLLFIFFIFLIILFLH